MLTWPTRRSFAAVAIACCLGLASCERSEAPAAPEEEEEVVPVCGEAACTPVAGAYISHFTELDCTGAEAYYTAYNGFDGVKRSWDGGGLAGTTLRTLTHKSFRIVGGACDNAWPAGNTLPDFVRIYR